MFQIDVFNLIPKALKQKAIDTTVDFIVNLGKGYLSDEITRRIKKLRSDGEFQEAFEDGLQRAANRFIEEFTDADEDLVEAISNDKTFFQNEDVQKALLAILKKPGIYSTDEQETVIKSFDSVLPNRRNRERVNQAVIYFLKCLAEEVWNLPELRPIYELQFQRMTAEAVREQVEIQKAQLQTSVALSTDIRDALLQLTDAVAERKLLPGGDDVDISSIVSHNLPQPDYERFIGRKDELKQIRHLLSPEHRSWVVTIDGIGGIGKSSLALEVANSYRHHFDKLPQKERFKAIIWITAKKTMLTGEGIITRPQSFRTLDDVYTTIAVTLQREDITRAPIDEQDDLVRQALTQQRTLLIIDNLETVDDERVMSFIREVPAPTKVIVTTRHRLDVAYPVRVVGMSEVEGLELIANESKLKGITLTQDEAKQLFKRTGGIPLAIVWSVAQMGFGYGVEAVLTRLGQPTSDIAKFCFEAAIERIRINPPYKLLLALSLFSTDASREALGYVTDLAELDRDDGLVELEKLSLVNKKGNRFHLLPLTSVYSQAEMAKAIDLEETFTNRWVEFFLEFLRKQHQNKYERLGNIKPELGNILGVLDWCWNNDRLTEFVVLAQEVNLYLWLTGRWTTRYKYLKLGIKATDTLGLELAKADLLRSLAAMIRDQGNLEESRNFINQAINIYESYGKLDETAKSLFQLSYIQIDCEEYEEAKHTLNKVWEIGNTIKSEWYTTIIDLQFAKIDVAKGSYDTAESRVHKVRKLHEQEEELSLSLTLTYRLLGEISLLKQNYDLAGQYFQQSLETAQQIENSLDVAKAKQRIAKLALALNDHKKVKQFADEAIEVFAKLGARQNLKETQSLLKHANKILS